ncbi:MAG: vitamin B12-dependent ribonucleotide reductase [Deltaproteobacteria bacterium]|nr:vitamin B12-dependent ribonucleotide reductase [Deltaproteobacteria bacterium]
MNPDLVTPERADITEVRVPVTEARRRTVPRVASFPRATGRRHGGWHPQHPASGTDSSCPEQPGVQVPRFFTQAGVDPFDAVEWERRDAAIHGEGGAVLFEQRDCEVPKSWSQQATNVVASKYFRGCLGTPERETSVRQLVGRVVARLSEWGRKGDYFRSAADAESFQAEITHLLLNQKMSFNSPVWFNLGAEGARQQTSACFINSVEDEMESVMDLAKTESMLFKGGSGAGTNLSALRSSRELLSGGGKASGPVAFMRGYDAFAGVVKSGGKTRRAAKMVILDVGHPDIREFVSCKADEEKKAWALIDAGYDGRFHVAGGAYDSVAFQNANHSVRVTDEFMQAAVEDREWWTHAVTNGSAVDSFSARELLRDIASAAHLCGDPGLQFDTVINRYNTVKASGRISASNPCSEYMFLNDTACNLASLNLTAFRTADGDFDVPSFRRAVALTILAQEIMLDGADYPTEAIADNSRRYRPLGLGYANLGALLMSFGLPYDSPEARSLAGAITSLLCGEAYRTSAEIAGAVGPFECFEQNRASFFDVIGLHAASAEQLEAPRGLPALAEAARTVWGEAQAAGRVHGYRNAQVSVLAPTGTIAFMMDCDTTGIEPDLALVKAKKLIDGGVMRIVNHTVPEALAALGYAADAVDAIVTHLDEKDTIEGAPGLCEEHLPVFDCALRPPGGTRSIHWLGHLRMMAAVQPFLSGAISKTVNLPSEATVDDVVDTYLEAWRLGLKALAIYRDGSKRTQPLESAGTAQASAAPEAPPAVAPQRRRLPGDRDARTHKFQVGGHEGYLTVGLYEDGDPGEIFLKMAKEGSTISGLMDTIATMTSLLLQYGVPLDLLTRKFSSTRFEPSGFTGNREIPFATSIPDYVFRLLAIRHGTPLHVEEPEQAGPEQARTAGPAAVAESDAPPCAECGSIMIRSGSCHRCLNCGGTSGCS